MGLINKLKKFIRRQKNRKVARDLTNKAKRYFSYGWSTDHPNRDTDIFLGMELDNGKYIGEGYIWKKEYYQSYGRNMWFPDEYITRDFILKCLEDGLGFDENKQKGEVDLDFYMATGLAVSNRDYSRALAITFCPYPPSVTEEEIRNEMIPRLTLSLIRWHRKNRINSDAEGSDYINRLKEMYEVAADKFSRINFGG